MKKIILVFMMVFLATGFLMADNLDQFIEESGMLEKYGEKYGDDYRFARVRGPNTVDIFFASKKMWEEDKWFMACRFKYEDGEWELYGKQETDFVKWVEGPNGNKVLRDTKFPSDKPIKTVRTTDKKYQFNNLDHSMYKGYRTTYKDGDTGRKFDVGYDFAAEIFDGVLIYYRLPEPNEYGATPFREGK